MDEAFEKEWTIVMVDKVPPLSEEFGGWPGTNGTLKIDWDPTVVEFERGQASIYRRKSNPPWKLSASDLSTLDASPITHRGEPVGPVHTAPNPSLVIEAT
jgi:hypothetical protein